MASTKLESGPVLLGIAKGAGMVHPDLGVDPPQATMLAFLFTDALVERGDLEHALVDAAAATFNACSVDGDTSPNDTLLALASGVATAPVSRSELTHALTQVCDELARAMVADGEGAAHVVEIWVRGLASEPAARQVARTIATSILVKTALHGKDANWGRLLAAAGRCGVRFDPNEARISIGDIEIVRAGVTLGQAAERRAAEVMAGPSYTIELVLGNGPGAARYLTSDLGHQYLDVNAGYRS